MFPRLDPKIYPIKNDQTFITELLQEEKVLLVQGTGFNWPAADHFRVVFLPPVEEIRSVAERMADFLKKYHQ